MSILIVKLEGSVIPSGYVYTFPNNNTVTNFELINSSEILEPGSLELVGGGGYLRLLGSDPIISGEDLILTYTPIEMPLGFEWIVRPPNIIHADEVVNISIKSQNIGPGDSSAIITLNDFVLTVTNNTPAEPYVYTNRDILIKTYGKQNIEQWADYDGTRNLPQIYQNIQQVCYDASRHVDARLAHGVYNTPFEFPYPPPIVNLTTMKASDILYTLGYKYTEEFSRGASKRREEFEKTLSGINAGRISLGLPQGGTAPF